MSPKPHSSPSSDQRGALQGGEKNDVKDEGLSKLPAHLQWVRDGLLDFKNFMGLQAAMLIGGEEEDAIPLSAYKPDGMSKSERARECELVESAQSLAAYAQSIDAQDGCEWYKLFRAVMTGRMDNGLNVHKSIAWAENEIRRGSAALNQPKPPTTLPTPSLYFGFSVQEVDKRAAAGFRNDSSFENYTREQLARLTTQGLHCMPNITSLVDKAMAQTTSKEPQPQSVCFPWGIFKAYGVSESPEANDASFASAVSHVSADASASLLMFERLAKFADEKHDGQHIPPVIAITSVGANTTVWLAYCDIVDDKIRDHKMISIWEGKITKIWDAIQFCRIRDNLFFWAQHCLKPKVTQYLSQWRLRYCPDVQNIYSLIEKDTRTAEIVHQIQDHLSSLGLSPSEDLPALVRQAVIFQEVIRSSNKEVKADLTSKEVKRPPAAAISLPSRPRDSSLEVALSSSTESRQGTNPIACPKEKEILYQDSGFLAGKNEKGTIESSNPHNTDIFKLKSPPKHQTHVHDFPDKGREYASENSTVLEDTKATSTKVFANKDTLKSKSSTISEADGVGNDKVLLSNPRQIKSPSAVESKSSLPEPSKEPDNANLNFIQRTLRSMASRVENGHVLSLEEQRRRNLDLLLKEEKPLNIKKLPNSLPRKDSNKEKITDRLSPSTNPFVSETFQLSFEVRPWLHLDMAGQGLPRIHRHGPYPTLCIRGVEHIEYPWRTGLHSDLRRVNLAQQPTIIEPLPPPLAPPLRVKVPWKGRYIIVKLPPANPASVLIKRNSDSLDK